MPVEWGPREPHFTVRMGTRDPQNFMTPGGPNLLEIRSGLGNLVREVLTYCFAL